MRRWPRPFPCSSKIALRCFGVNNFHLLLLSRRIGHGQYRGRLGAGFLFSENLGPVPKIAPELLDGTAQLHALARHNFGSIRVPLPPAALKLPRQHMQPVQQFLPRRPNHRLPLRRRFALRTQKKNGLVHQPFPRRRRTPNPPLPQLREVSVRQLLIRDRIGQPPAVLPICLGQWHQRPHRSLDRDLTPTHVLLYRGRQRLSQRQAARHPAAATPHTPRQLLTAPAFAALQLQKQPTFLKSRSRRAAQAVADQQTFFLARRQYQRLDRVTTQTPQRTDALVPVKHPETIRIPCHRSDHDRHLLTGFLHGYQKTSLQRRGAHPKLRVVQVQLVELQIHPYSLFNDADAAGGTPDPSLQPLQRRRRG
jgi:hypothetical protein